MDKHRKKGTPRRLAVAIAIVCSVSAGSANAATGMSFSQFLSRFIPFLDLYKETEAQNTEEVIGTVEEQEEQTRDKIEEANTRDRNHQVNIYNAEVARDQQPTTFCPGDQKITGQYAKAATQKTYAGTVTSYNKFNSPAARDGARFIKDENTKLKTLVNNPSSNCDPRIMPPISKGDVQADGDRMKCSEAEIEAIVNLASGRKPTPQPPVAYAETARGQVMKNEVDIYNMRMSVIDQSLSGTLVEEKDTMLEAFDKLAQSPSVDEINAMSGKGAVGRTALFQQQIETQLMIHIYKEIMQQNRLLATIASQGQEAHYQKVMKINSSLSGNEK